MSEKYRVIIADPAWSYANSGCRGTAHNEYSTMSIEDICALPVSNVAHDDAVLLLWATWPLLTEAFQVVESWGFTYTTGMPWVKLVGVPSMDLWGETYMKPQYGVGFWIRGCSEPLLICKRGNAKPPKGGHVGLLSENFKHSRKPENLYDYAETLPGPYLELFARRTRPGWTCLGNEITGNDLREDLRLISGEDLSTPALAGKE